MATITELLLENEIETHADNEIDQGRTPSAVGFVLHLVRQYGWACRAVASERRSSEAHRAAEEHAAAMLALVDEQVRQLAEADGYASTEVRKA